MKYYYHWSYIHSKDTFFAYVTKDNIDCPIVFQIDDTDEIFDLINTGVMNHIDDIKGLEKFLKTQEIMQAGDKLINNRG